MHYGDYIARPVDRFLGDNNEQLGERWMTDPGHRGAVLGLTGVAGQ